MISPFKRREAKGGDPSLPHWESVETENLDVNYARDVAQEQIAWWISKRLEPGDAYEILYEIRCDNVSWENIERLLINKIMKGYV